MHKTTTLAAIQSVDLLNSHVYKVLLTPEQPVIFQAGQYLEIGVTQNTWVPFSIACAPGGSTLELHIQYIPKSESSVLLQKQLKKGEKLNLRLAFGQCLLPEHERQLLLIAAGTGFAQIKSLLEEAFKRRWQSLITLYWGARQPEGLYALEQALAWEKQYSNFTVIPSVDVADSQWQGRIGNIVDSLAINFIAPNSAKYIRGIASGSPAMVYAVEDFLLDHGLPAKGLTSDVHAYAPRKI